MGLKPLPVLLTDNGSYIVKSRRTIFPLYPEEIYRKVTIMCGPCGKKYSKVVHTFQDGELQCPKCKDTIEYRFEVHG